MGPTCRVKGLHGLDAESSPNSSVDGVCWPCVVAHSRAGSAGGANGDHDPPDHRQLEAVFPIFGGRSGPRVELAAVVWTREAGASSLGSALARLGRGQTCHAVDDVRASFLAASTIGSI